MQTPRIRLVLIAGLVMLGANSAGAALIANWTFDNSADPYADSSGYGNNGVKTGAGTLTWVVGPVGGGALTLDGAAWLNVGSNAVFDTQTYTVSGWLYKGAAAGNSWRGAAGDWNAGWMHFGQNDTGRFSNFVRVDGAQKNMIGTSAIQTGQWQHVVSVVDKNNKVLQLWVDGVREVNDTSITTWGATSVPGATDVQVGTPYAAGTYAWVGQLDDVAIWNRALTAAEIAQVRSQGLQGIGAAQALARSPASGLLSYYAFENNSFDTARHYRNSSSTNDDNLTAVGSVSFVPGVVGTAARLSGGYFTAPNVAVDDLDLPNTFTIETWINPDAITGTFQRLVLNWGGGTQNAYHFGLLGDDVNLYLRLSSGSDYQVASGGTMVAGQWQHIAAVSDGAIVMLYLNGQEVARGTLTGNLNQTTTEGLGIGDSVSGPSTGFRFAGLIDELAFWNVALSPEQIDEHFLAGAAGYGLTTPEPGTFALLVCGGLLTAAVRMRRRRK